MPMKLDAPEHDTPAQIRSRQSNQERLIREADWHYQLGRKHYQEGQYDSARREFDRAIEVLLDAPESDRGAVDRKLEELVDQIHRLDLAGLGSADTGEPAYEKSPLEDIPQMTFPVDPKLKDKVLEEMRATVSQLPLDVNDAVLSYINYFSTERGRKTLLAGLRRSGRYRPLIQRILDEEGVPQELMFVAQAESGFLPRAVSRKRAVGMWQFVQSRGREYGLTQTPYSDDRLDPEKATRAAAKHLRDLYQRYGDWYLALVGYNAGPGVVDRAVERTGYADFWEFRRRNVLPKETANYIPIILAMTIMVKNGAAYDIDDIDLDPPLEYETVDLDAPTNLALIADLAECPVSQIRELNPALLKDLAPAGTLRLPKGTPASALAALDLVPADKRRSWRAHRVANGDTLASIAQRYRVAAGSIASVNAALAGPPVTGELLLIPAAPPQRAAVVKRAAAKKRPAVRRASGVRHASKKLAARRTTVPASKIAYNTSSKRRAVKR